MTRMKFHCAIALTLLLCATSYGQGSPPQSESQLKEDSAGESTQVHEELVTVGQRTRRALREQIRLVEDQMYTLFNELNDDDEYDVHCEMETATGTLISRRVCKPQFVNQATANEGVAALNQLRGESGGVYMSATSIVLYKNEILRDKLAVLARENPELLNALVRLAELRGAVETDEPQAVDSEQDE